MFIIQTANQLTESSDFTDGFSLGGCCRRRLCFSTRRVSVGVPATSKRRNDLAFPRMSAGMGKGALALLSPWK